MTASRLPLAALRTPLVAGAALGLAGLLAALLADAAAAWAGYLAVLVLCTGLALAGPLFLSFLFISGARWSRPLERVLCALGAALPFSAALALLLPVGLPALYEWSHASAVAGDPVLEAKRAYLSAPFFVLRTAVYFVVWLVGARHVARVAAETRDGAAGDGARRRRAGALFLLLFAPTFSLAGIDWTLSLEPHAFSSIHAVVALGATAVSGLAAAVLLAAWAERRELVRVTEAQWGDAGALLLAFGLFWGYVWYSQYLLVWYTDMPEETPWFAARLRGDWGLLTKVSLAAGCALPFAALLMRSVRRSRSALVRIACVVLAARVIDVFVAIGPPLLGASPARAAWSVLPVVGAACAFALVTTRALATAAVPHAAASAGPRAPAAHSSG